MIARSYMIVAMATFGVNVAGFAQTKRIKQTAPIPGVVEFPGSVVSTMPLKPMIFSYKDPKALPTPLASGEQQKVRPAQGKVHLLRLEPRVRVGWMRASRRPPVVKVEERTVDLKWLDSQD